MRFDRSLAARLVAVAAIALAVAAPTAALLGWLAMEAALGSSTDQGGWEELGAALFGAAVALAVGVGTYTATVTVTARRLLPAGRRLRGAAAAVALPVTLVATVGMAGEVVPLAAAPLALAIVVICGGVAGVMPARTTATVAVPAFALALGCIAVVAVATAASDREERRAAIERMQSLPLVDGRTLDRPYEDWSLRRVDYDDYDATVRVTWDVAGDGGGDAHLDIGPEQATVRVHVADFRTAQRIEDDLESRLVYVSADRFIEACGRRC